MKILILTLFFASTTFAKEKISFNLLLGPKHGALAFYVENNILKRDDSGLLKIKCIQRHAHIDRSYGKYEASQMQADLKKYLGLTTYRFKAWQHQECPKTDAYDVTPDISVHYTTTDGRSGILCMLNTGPIPNSTIATDYTSCLNAIDQIDNQYK